jgi:hypothetical protein
MAEGIDHDVHLRALPFFRTVKPGAVPALRRTLQRATVNDDGGGFAAALLFHTAEQPQIVHGILEAVRFEPPFGLTSHDLRWRKVMGKKRPL